MQCLLVRTGILSQVQTAKKQTSIAEEKELITLAYNAVKAEEKGGDVTVDKLDNELEKDGASAMQEGTNIKVTFAESRREYMIDENGNITEVEGVTEIPTQPEESEPGNYYSKDTKVIVADETLVIPGGATISKISGEYEDVDNGVVIYITNKEIEDTEWEKDENGNRIKDVQEEYDQFVWVPVEDALAVDMNADSIINKTDIDLMVSAGRYPMAIKTSETYKGILYNFEEEGESVKITAYDYNADDSYREPDITSDYDTSSTGITQESLQGEYKEMVERVESAGGFWVGRYETSKMSMNIDIDDSETEFVEVKKGATEGINEVHWYRMYLQQKNYEKHLSNSNNVKSSMIWGSQWDQIMIWMKDEENKKNMSNGKFYITNSVGKANLGPINGIDDGWSEESPAPTGYQENYKVRNIYDLSGNVNDCTLEASTSAYRTSRGGDYKRNFSSKPRASERIDFYADYYNSYSGSRATIYTML